MLFVFAGDDDRDLVSHGSSIVRHARGGGRQFGDGEKYSPRGFGVKVVSMFASVRMLRLMPEVGGEFALGFALVFFFLVLVPVIRVLSRFSLSKMDFEWE